MNLPERDDEACRAEPVTDVLARIRAELEEIAAGIDRNQAVIAKATWRAGAADADYVRAMQDADLSAQRIAGVAGFLRAIGNAAHPLWRVDTAPATGTLKLAGQVRAIGPAGPKVEAKEEDAAGDVCFF